MRTSFNFQKAFTLLELLVVIAVIAILAALILPTIGGVKVKSKETTCINNLKQIGMGLMVYASDSGDRFPAFEAGASNNSITPDLPWIVFKARLEKAENLPEKIFACPADTYYYDVTLAGPGYVATPRHEWAMVDFSSYSFNAVNLMTNVPSVVGDGTWPGIGGRTMASVVNPSPDGADGRRLGLAAVFVACATEAAAGGTRGGEFL